MGVQSTPRLNFLLDPCENGGDWLDFYPFLRLWSRMMRLAAAGRLLLSTFLLISLAAGQATAQSKSTKKRPNGEKKPSTETKEPDKSADSKKATTSEKKPSATADGAKAKDGDKKEAAAKPATVKVKKGPFHLEVSLDGVFEAQDQAELVVRPQEWPLLQVLKRSRARMRRSNKAISFWRWTPRRSTILLPSFVQNCNSTNWPSSNPRPSWRRLGKVAPWILTPTNVPSGWPRRIGSSIRRWKSRSP